MFYISGHGFGHASRSIEIINALIDRRPELRVIIRSSVAPWLVERTAHAGVVLSSAAVDTGVIQLDSLHLDALGSIARAEAFMATFEQRVDSEVAFLRDHDAVMTISDLPPLGIAAGHAAGIAAFATGNFTWDWIYEHYEGGQSVADHIGTIYRLATKALRMPMWGGFATFPEIHDLPFVARRSRREGREVREAFGLPLDRPIVLTSFGGYGLEALDEQALTELDGYHVLTPAAFNDQVLYERGFRYEDLVKAVDVVVTKPGYGIISECLANQTALLYTSRGDFREYPVLVDAMPAFLRCGYIPHDDLFRGRWQPYLDAVISQPAPPTTPAANGADVAADILLRSLS